MKKVLLLIILITNLSFGQTNKEKRETLELDKASTCNLGGIKYNINGLTDFTVIEASGLSQKDIYIKTKNWIKEYYKNPDEVIESDIENQKIRFNGIKTQVYAIAPLGNKVSMDFKYSLMISFKDGKCKFDPISLKKINPKFPTTSSKKWININLENGSKYYKKNGDVRKWTMYELTALGCVFSETSILLKDYLNDVQDPNKDDSW